MSPVSQNRITHIGKMRRLSFLHQQTVFVLARVTDHAASSDDNVATNVSSWTDLNALADPSGPLYHAVRRKLDRRMQENLALHVNTLRKLVLIGVPLQIGQSFLDPRDPLPRQSIGIEKMLKRDTRRKIEKIGCFHGWRACLSRAEATRICSQKNPLKRGLFQPSNDGFA